MALPYRYQRFGWNRLQKPLIVECPGGRVTFTREMHGAVRVDFANGEAKWAHPGALRVLVPYHPGPVHYANEPDRDAHLCPVPEDAPPACTPGLCDSCDAKRLAAHEALEECYATAQGEPACDLCADCEHGADEHVSHASGARPCGHHGCGCGDFTVPEDEMELLRLAALNRGQP